MQSRTANSQICPCDIVLPKDIWQGKLRTVKSSWTDLPERGQMLNNAVAAKVA